MFQPIIKDNSFFENKATQILKNVLNDHCFVFDGSKWHFLTSRGRHAVGGISITDKMEFVEPFPNLQLIIQTSELWAPCSVVKDNQVFVFYAKPEKSLRPDPLKFAEYIANGGIFTMVLAQSPVNNLSQLKITHELFSDTGGARDPFVFWDKKVDQWVILYAKRIYENKDKIESGIAYRTSKDLIHWSEPKGYVIWDLFYDDEIKEKVTVSLGNGESPQLIEYDEKYYLFVTHVGYRNYHRTKVWVSDTPYRFGPVDKPLTTLYTHAPEIIKEDNKYYISNCGVHQKEFAETGNGLRVPGIEIASLHWLKQHLYIITDLPFSGKSTLAKELVKRFGFERTSVDKMMNKRKMDEVYMNQEDWNLVYSEAYEELEKLLQLGKSVAFDGGSLLKSERNKLKKIAEKCGVKWKLIYMNTPKEVILERRNKVKKTNERDPLEDETMDKAFEMMEEPVPDEKAVIFNPNDRVDDWINKYILF